MCDPMNPAPPLSRAPSSLRNPQNVCLYLGKYLRKAQCGAISHASWQVLVMGKRGHLRVVRCVVISKEGSAAGVLK